MHQLYQSKRLHTITLLLDFYNFMINLYKNEWFTCLDIIENINERHMKLLP
ncbi:hypothetical protein J6TS1_12760 [Siminovitchia terrae]|uniref:Maturase K n=1 Tax=Siminovitchia terrae TaxID=1914933 RepID=A0ABQ4KTR2_SIMTE|nr:hypothetical protein J22TS1_03850 [Siminovitchia terrae]GIN95406.1 hypothetical protein J6TS1_12760 [Siminovitchia terrae]